MSQNIMQISYHKHILSYFAMDIYFVHQQYPCNILVMQCITYPYLY